MIPGGRLADGLVSPGPRQEVERPSFLEEVPEPVVVQRPDRPVLEVAAQLLGVVLVQKNRWDEASALALDESQRERRVPPEPDLPARGAAQRADEAVTDPGREHPDPPEPFVVPRQGPEIHSRPL